MFLFCSFFFLSFDISFCSKFANQLISCRVQELVNARQLDRQNIQQTERRLVEERRQRQSLDSQLNNERKQRKQAEERAVRYIFHYISIST